MSCIRCGRTEDIEEHHIKERCCGGGDEPENKENRCHACHKYEHARRKLLGTIKATQEKIERSRKLSRRLALRSYLDILNHRLEVLDSLNTPERIRLTGEYTTYWEDDSTHDVIPVPKDNPNLEPVEQERLLP